MDRGTNDGHESANAAYVRSDGYRHAPFAPTHSIRTEVSRTNGLHPSGRKPQHSQSAGGGSAAMPVTSLTTAESLAESLLVKASLACEQRAWAVKVSSASRALSKRKESKCERHTQGAGLRNRGRGFDIGGPHRTTSPDASLEPRNVLTATPRGSPRRPLSRPP